MLEDHATALGSHAVQEEGRNDSNDKITSMSAELVYARKQVEDLDAHNRSLKAQVDRLELENLSSSSASEDRLAHLTRELEAANAEIARMLEDHATALGSHVVQEEELRGSIHRLESDIRNLNSKLDCIQYERESEMAEQSLRSKMLHEEVTQAKKEIQDLASLVILFDFPAESRSSELRDELDEIVTVDCDEIDIAQCTTTIYGIINSYDNFYQNSARTTAELRNNIESLTSQLSSAGLNTMARLEVAEKALADVNVQLSIMNKQCADIQMQLVAEKDRSEALSRRENDYLRERDSLLAELDKMRMDTEGHTIDLEAKLAQTSQLLEEAHCVGAGKDDAIARLQASNSELHADIRSLRSKIADLNAKLEGAEADIKHFQGKLFSQSEPLTQVVASLRQERDSLRSDLIAKETEVNELLSERSSLNGRVAGFVVAFEGIQEELQSVRNERDELETQLSAKVKLVSSMKSEVSNATIEIKRRDEEIARVLEQSRTAKVSMQQQFALQQTNVAAKMRSVHVLCLNLGEIFTKHLFSYTHICTQGFDTGSLSPVR
jgi:chromosome segregation ATPase